MLNVYGAVPFTASCVVDLEQLADVLCYTHQPDIVINSGQKSAQVPTKQIRRSIVTEELRGRPRPECHRRLLESSLELGLDQ